MSELTHIPLSTYESKFFSTPNSEIKISYNIETKEINLRGGKFYVSSHEIIRKIYILHYYLAHERKDIKQRKTLKTSSTVKNFIHDTDTWAKATYEAGSFLDSASLPKWKIKSISKENVLDKDAVLEKITGKDSLSMVDTQQTSKLSVSIKFSDKTKEQLKRSDQSFNFTIIIN